jgi:hypothetical protein
LAATPALLAVAGVVLGFAVVAAPLGLVARSRGERTVPSPTATQVHELEARAATAAHWLRLPAGAVVATTAHAADGVVAEVDLDRDHRVRIALSDGPPVTPASPCRGRSAPPALACAFAPAAAGRPALLTRTTVRPAPPGTTRGQEVLATGALTDPHRATWLVCEVDAFWPDGSLSVVQEAARTRPGAVRIAVLVAPAARLRRLAAAPGLRWSATRSPTGR